MKASAFLPESEKSRLEALARRRWSLDWWLDNHSVSPLRGALSVFGLTGDDITVASCHGTSTKKNDLNEPEILEKEMKALGRSPGNPLYIVTQKWLTGHPKGPAAAWQMNGMVQAMCENVIPGNRNLDCVDPDLRKFETLFFTDSTVRKQYISAALVNSFGFGQAGGQCLLIHPDYFLASVEEDCFQVYLQTLNERMLQMFKHKQDVLGNRTPFVPIKEPSNTPHSVAFGQAILQKDMRRARTLPRFSAPAPTEHLQSNFKPPPRTAQTGIEQALMEATSGGTAGLAMGIDAEPIQTFEQTFLQRNFSVKELKDIHEHDATTGTERTATGHWAVKEAVVKALGNAGATLRSASQPLCDIEVLRRDSGSLGIQLHGEALGASEKLQVKDIRVSLTYAQGTAYAAAILV